MEAVELSGDSEVVVAYALTKDILSATGRTTSVGANPDSSKRLVTEEELLNLFVRCLDATSKNRTGAYDDVPG